MQNITIIIRILAMTAISLLAFGPPNPGQTAQTETDQFSCTNVTEIPQIECEALVALYNETDGPNWEENILGQSSIKGWLVTNTPCSWTGVICDGGRVTILRLKGGASFRLFGLRGHIPASIGNLTSLTRLELAYNQLSSLPTTIGSLSNLTRLELTYNQLNSLPNEIVNLNNLAELYLDSNQLSSLPADFTRLVALNHLNIDHNHLTDLTAELQAFLDKYSQLWRRWQTPSRETIPVTVTPTSTTNTPTPISTNVPLPTSTFTPSYTPKTPSQDTYEPDDNCTDATTIQPNSTTHAHTFHKQSDVDWIKFEGQADTTYRIEIIVPDDSQADVVLDLYPDCQSVSDIGWDKSFSPDVRLDFTTPATGPIYLRLANHRSEIYGPEISYQLTVRPLVEESENRALIIVAGRYEIGDPLQENIHYVTDLVYRTFHAYGYGDDNIRYLATDSGLTGYDDPADLHHLEAAVTNWAAKQLTAGGVLNIYMMDHGNVDKFYLDEPADEVLTPTDLDGWLSQLEDAVPDLRINIMIEACQSGSFISFENGSISRPGRLVVTSTNDTNDAYASSNGAYFSDQYWAWLHRGFNLAASFREARSAARNRAGLQDAWLDANGNGIPNEFDDATAAALVGFGIANSFNSNWPPHVFSAQPPAMLNGFSGTIYADVRDDHNVRQVSATIYPPSYTPPETRNELMAEPLTEIILNRQPNADSRSSDGIAQENRYAATYNFVEKGTYRIIINAEDREGLSARPLEITFSTGDTRLYLPLIRR